MKTTIVLVVAFLIALAFAAPEHQKWETFQKLHNKVYKTQEEAAKRRAIFDENMKKAAVLELKNPEAQFGATPYADMTEAEFKVYHNAERHYAAAQKELHKTPFSTKFTDEQIKAIPQAVDWRTKNVVTPVKNQAECGSCWAFSTTGGIEGQWALAGNPLTSLSEQELVSCDTIDDGCNGGLMSNAYNWLLENKDGKLVTEASYPYVSGMGNVPACDLTDKKFGAQINGHENIYHDENQMSAWTAKNGPISIAVDAGMSWQLYFGGVVTSCGQGSLDHGVLIVGYTDRNGTGAEGSYWIVKNSWGGGWGEKGYIYLAKGSNQCSITQYPVSSIIGTVPPTQPPAVAKPGYFVHAIYDNQNCTIGEWDLVWEQNKCISWDGVSFKAVCVGDSLNITAYYDSLDCTGKTKDLTENVNKCAQSTKDDVYYNTRCPKTAPAGGSRMNYKAMAHFAKLHGKK